ncbi:GlxA family transcriptional regulator [Chitinophaga niabensis]|uniref:Transcriptional regulator GlxA family, contains an amidase domain and an AraC-type DNA-binding HTH domain n=1 Tax=Chitinophaga niabensis TaxID=536979 RepID=A0A1N6FMM2_9BACT|nr:helix-turn-helix domain-containing protein [Chitinophaga niabensis]SIN96521.1 Transcriptional regulator GlxA family, contains an amidase domain and an AraC-type DNA-binding HTH domain [Chitinophaga niabensis]
MRTLTILVPEGQDNLTSVVGAYKFFTKANAYFKKEVFHIQLAGVTKEVDLYDGLFAIRPQTHIRDIEKTDLIIIPALAHNNIPNVLARNAEAISWIKQQRKQGAEIASICTGAFLLASTGLLKGRVCSTHWNAAGKFAELFPDVDLQTDKIITDEQGIYTNGGAFSFMNLLLYLIEKYYDRATAVFCAKVFQVDIDRSSQSPFTIFNGQKDHADEEIRKAQNYLESNLSDKISMDELASSLAISRRNFDRRFIKATGNTPIEYQQRVKIELAKKSLESGRKTINEVMYEVGYADTKAFRDLFKKITGLAPIDYRNKYNKDAAVNENY